MGPVHDAVQDGIGQRGLIQPGVPGRHRQLTGDERGSATHPVVQQLQQIIDAAWENRASMSPTAAPKDVIDAVEQVISQLNKGVLRGGLA